MRVTDEHYYDMKSFYQDLVSKADGCETLEEFVTKYAEDLFINDSNIADGVITVDNDGDTYTISMTEYGLEVSNEVEVFDPVMRCETTIQIGLWD